MLTNKDSSKHTNMIAKSNISSKRGKTELFEKAKRPEKDLFAGYLTERKV